MLNILEQAEDIVKRNWPRGRCWKAFLIISLVILSILGVVALAIWAFGKLIKSITTGGYRNINLYYPRSRR